MGILLKKRMAVLGVLVLLALAIIYVINPAGDKKEKTTEVYVAKEMLAAGDDADSKFLVKVPVSRQEEWMISDLGDLKGKKWTRNVPPGRYLDINDVSDESPIVFSDNEGEFSIRTKPEFVNGGRIAPGDIVRVIYVPNPNSANQDLTVVQQPKGEVVVRDVVVLSVRTQYAKDVEDYEKKNDYTSVPASIVLKVNEDQAEDLAWYQENGSLSLYVVKKGEGLK